MFAKALLAAALILAAPALAVADPVSLRGAPTASGAAITLDDLFENAGPAGARPIAPAPAAGRAATLSPRFVQAAARASGLDWSPPEDLKVIVVTGAGGAGQPAPLAGRASSSSNPNAVIRRGDIVLVIYAAGGVRITTRARAAQDAAEGESLQLQNAQTNRTIDAIATGPGAALALSK